MANIEVVVGNIGKVYSGDDADRAAEFYDEYVNQSKAGYGRAAGEPVTLLRDGEPTLEYAGKETE